MGSKETRVNFVLLADSHRTGKHGKIDSFGIFTNINIWAIPAIREFSIVFGIENVPAKRTIITVLLKKNEGRSRKIATGEMASGTPKVGSVTGLRITWTFKSTGKYKAGIRVGKKHFWLPFQVTKQPWPERLTGKELASALADPNTSKVAQVQFTCRKCGRKHRFEVHLSPHAKRSKGSADFPPDGKFKCPKCKTIHHLKDFEGQLLSNLGRVIQKDA